MSRTIATRLAHLAARYSYNRSPRLNRRAWERLWVLRHCEQDHGVCARYSDALAQLSA